MRLLVLPVLLAAVPVVAQDAPGANAAYAALQAADKDKDGRWTKQEWLAAGRREQGFAFMDADKDGYVTRQELLKGVAQMQSMGLGTPN